MAAVPPPPDVTLLPVAVQGVACESCHTRSARWLALKVPRCSYCITYGTPWGLANADALAALHAHRERTTGTPLDRDGSGRVTSTEALDMILAAVVLPWVMEHRRRQCL